MILKCLEASECSTSSNQLVAEFGLVLIPIVVVDLIVGVLRFTCVEIARQQCLGVGIELARMPGGCRVPHMLID